MAEFAALVQGIKDHPETFDNVCENMSLDELQQMAKELNPYLKIAGPKHDPAKPRVAMACFTNCREEYMRKFITTAVAGFLFRMADEHAPEPEVRRWRSKAAAKIEAKQPFTFEDRKSVV